MYAELTVLQLDKHHVPPPGSVSANFDRAPNGPCGSAVGNEISHLEQGAGFKFGHPIPPAMPPEWASEPKATSWLRETENDRDPC